MGNWKMFADEKIQTEDVEKKSEENLISITLVLTLFCIAVNISVGDVWFDGTGFTAAFCCS